MNRAERAQLRQIADQVRAWSDTAAQLRQAREQVTLAAGDAAARLAERAVTVALPDDRTVRILPLTVGDEELLTATARAEAHPAIPAGLARAIDLLSGQARDVVDAARTVTTMRRLFTGAAARRAGERAAETLTEMHANMITADVPGRLIEATGALDRLPTGPVAPSAALDRETGLAGRLDGLGAAHTMLFGSAPAELPRAAAALTDDYERDRELRATIDDAALEVRTRAARRLLDQTPVERLKDTTAERLLGPLTDAGLGTVGDVLDSGHLIGHLPGIGEVSATRIRGAAQTLLTLTVDDTPVRIDPADRSGPAERIVFALAHWAALRPLLGDADTRAAVTALLPLAHSLSADTAAVAVFSSPPIEPVAAALGAQIDRVIDAAERHRSTQAGSVPDDPWADFLADPARYLALLAELGVLGDDGAAARGDLPDQIVEAVRAVRLDTSLLRATLRGYQDFAARFALVQHKTLIGDEMGLGKTVEALAVATHLSAGTTGTHHLVVCPAAVVANWVRETVKHTRLPAHRLHGTGRDGAAAQWISRGGVAVTTFETLAWLERAHPNLPEVSLVIVDEAHYIKNPGAQRSVRTAALIAAARYAVLLTGTPMENRIDEFATLVGYLQPDLVLGAGEVAPVLFRRQVAPAYLRRNQEDVLTELPELIEVDELLPLAGADLQAYTAAVHDGGFARMRQAAMLQGAQSAKIARLVEIAEEAAPNGRKILVFSFFLSVLDAVAKSVPGRVFGPLTGAVPAAARQELVDEFSAAEPGAVLVAQITAGGVGLNIQAASVVVLCEPQLKPTSEWQAIARARRMGQLEAVQVHRLLSEDGVDQRLLELLARKSELFDDFARISETAGSAEEAYDVSETALAREVIAAERARLAVGAP